MQRVAEVPSVVATAAPIGCRFPESVSPGETPGVYTGRSRQTFQDDAGFGQFFSILTWVCWKRKVEAVWSWGFPRRSYRTFPPNFSRERGVYFGKVDYRYTSQICPNCGAHTGKKDLSERIHKCPECQYEVNRDVASAKVICNRGITAALADRRTN